MPGLSWLLLPGRFSRNDVHRARSAGPDLLRHVFDQDFGRSMDARRVSSGLRSLRRARRRTFHLHLLDRESRGACSPPASYVARGRNAGEKLETTIALTPAAFQSPAREAPGNAFRPIGSRNGAGRPPNFPPKIEGGPRSSFEKLIREHEQFRNLGGPERLPLAGQDFGVTADLPNGLPESA